MALPTTTADTFDFITNGMDSWQLRTRPERDKWPTTSLAARLLQHAVSKQLNKEQQCTHAWLAAVVNLLLICC